MPDTNTAAVADDTDLDAPAATAQGNDTDPFADIACPYARFAARAAASGTGKKMKIVRKTSRGKRTASIPYSAGDDAVSVARAAAGGTTITDEVAVPGITDAMAKRPTTFTGVAALHALRDFGAMR